MAKRYMPDAESELVDWLINFGAQMTNSGAALDFSVAEIAAITNAIALVQTNLISYDTAKLTLETALEAKNAAKEAAVALARAAVPRIQAHPLCTDNTRTAFRITIRDTEPSAAGVPVTRPVLQLLLTALYTIIVSFADEGTPTRKAKPAGVMGCLLQYKKGGTAPASDAEWQLLAIDTATPYHAVFDSADAGTIVYIRACWINSQQERGPWSATQMARIPA